MNGAVMESGQLSGGYVSDSFEAPTSLGVLSRRVLRRDAPGATVILIHESPGISDSTFEVASALAGEGYRLVLPELLDAAWSWKGPVHTIANVTKLCVARELGALALGQTGAIVEWLRALADEEHAATKRPVAVIGMCFSGGFALGTIRSSSVSAAVMSQPSLPFVIRIGRSDLGLSKDDLDAITARVGRGDCIRAMRFSRDRKSPASRLALIQRTFPAAECRTVGTNSPKHHSVLGMAVRPGASADLRAALAETLDFLRRHLDRAG